MADEPTSTVSFRLPASFAEQLVLRAKATGQRPGEYVRELVVKNLTDDSEKSLDEQNAEAINAIRSLANLLRGDVATLTNVLLIEVAKWPPQKAKNWVEQTFRRASL